MIRILAFVLLLGSALAAPEESSPDVIVLSPEETDQIIYDLQGRQSTTSSSSGLGWLRQNSVNEAFSVLFGSSDHHPICRTGQESYQEGICQRVSDCLYFGGQRMGSCGAGLGSCCVFEQKCNDTTSSFVSHFVNPAFSTIAQGIGECKLTVNPMNNNICQYRIDFEKFEVLGPDSTSSCVDDFFTVTGGSSVPILCGDLSGQHIYVNVKPGAGPVLLTVDTSKVRSMARQWKIKITQIGCNAPGRAPVGCLQFFNTTSGTVKSFNFHRNELNEIAATGTSDQGQIRNLNYAICINPKNGYCDMTVNEQKSFSLSGDAAEENGTIHIGYDDCKTDYIEIPGAYYEDLSTKTRVPVSRFCGTKFPKNVRTNRKPYLMWAITDDNEDNDMKNMGFELNFRQNLCHT